MSAELVRRLRLGFFSDVATEIASKAADEIERLTAERETLNRCLFQAQEAAKDLAEQLRAAREQEPVAWRVQTEASDFVTRNKTIVDEYVENCSAHVTPYYAAPVPQPQEARDAERWRWLRENGKEMTYDALLGIIEEYGDRADAKLDAAILAAKEEKR